MANKLEADLIIIQGKHQGRPICLEVSEADEIRFVLNELGYAMDDKDVIKIDSMQFRSQTNTLRLTLFILGNEVNRFEVLNEFVKTNGIWHKSPINIALNLMGYFIPSRQSA